MESRPVLDYEGQQFIRQNCAWVTSNRMRVPAAVESRLDSVAKADQALWQRCLAQDVTDRVPQQRHVAGIDTAGHRGFDVHTDSGFDCVFDSDRLLTVNADLEKNWLERKKGWGFWGERRLPALHGHTLRVQLTFFSPQPTAPKVDRTEGEVHGIQYRAEDHRIQLTFALFDAAHRFNSILQWGETENGKPMVFRDAFRFTLRAADGGRGSGSQGYLCNLLLVVQPPEQKPAAIYFEWSRRFFPGGLPSLGKRHS